jgi:hypothetical protein
LFNAASGLQIEKELWLLFLISKQDGGAGIGRMNFIIVFCLCAIQKKKATIGWFISNKYRGKNPKIIAKKD